MSRPSFEEPRRHNASLRRRLPGQAWMAEKMLNAIRGRGHGRGHDPEPDSGGVPVEPNNPRNLSGGAAAVSEAEQ